MKDDDERLPIHWAAAYNRVPVVELLVAMKDFDPDVEVGITDLFPQIISLIFSTSTAPFHITLLNRHRMDPVGHLL